MTPNLQIGFAQAMSKLNWNRIEDTLPVNASEQIEVIAARNEVVGVQVRLMASEPFTLTLDRSNWLNALGHALRIRLEVSFPDLPANAVEVFSVGYVEGDGRIQWQEYLDRSGYADCPAHRPQSTYIRLRVPANLAPDTYEGRVIAFTQTDFEDEQNHLGREPFSSMFSQPRCPIRETGDSISICGSISLPLPVITRFRCGAKGISLSSNATVPVWPN